MALEDTMKEEAPKESAPENSALNEEEEQDLRIAVNLSKNMIDDGGIDVIKQAIETSNDPGQIIGRFLMQLVSQLHESLPEGVDLSKKIYFAHGGWIEQISDYLQEEYDIDSDVMDRAEMFIGAQAQAMAQGQASQDVSQVGAGAAQPMPQPEVPMNGGV